MPAKAIPLAEKLGVDNTSVKWNLCHSGEDFRDIAMTSLYNLIARRKPPVQNARRARRLPASVTRLRTAHLRGAASAA